MAWEEGGFKSFDLRKSISKAAAICREADYMNSRFKVLAPEAVFLAFGLIVLYTDRWEPPDRLRQAGERAVLRMRYEETEHFVVEGGHNMVGWDPWSDEGSRTGKNGYVVDKRIFKVLGVAKAGAPGRFNG